MSALRKLRKQQQQQQAPSAFLLLQQQDGGNNDKEEEEKGGSDSEDDQEEHGPCTTANAFAFIEEEDDDGDDDHYAPASDNDKKEEEEELGNQQSHHACSSSTTPQPHSNADPPIKGDEAETAAAGIAKLRRMKKKRKKKRKAVVGSVGGAKNAAGARVHTTAAGAAARMDQDGDVDIDAIAKELDAEARLNQTLHQQQLPSLMRSTVGAAVSTSSSSATHRLSSHQQSLEAAASPLATTDNQLDAQAELIRRFGAKIVRAGSGNGSSSSVAAASGSTRHRRHKRQQQRGKVHLSLRHRRTHIVSAETSWPPFRLELVMKRQHSLEGLAPLSSSSTEAMSATTTSHDPRIAAAPLMFVFDATDDYKSLDAQYRAVVATCDPTQVAYFVAQHPWHPKAVLQLSYLLEARGDIERAFELVRRCVFVYECAMRREFCALVMRGGNGTALLPYDNDHNATFFTALDRYARMICKRGCPRTAMEVAKFILSLSPVEDPMCIWHSLPYYALRVRHAPFLRQVLRFFSSASSSSSMGIAAMGGRSRVLAGLPGWLVQPSFLFACALAARQTDVTMQVVVDEVKLTPSSIAAHLSGTSQQLLADLGARSLMILAVLVFPEGLQALLKESAHGKGFVTSRKWQKNYLVLSSPYAKIQPFVTAGNVAVTATMIADAARYVERVCTVFSARFSSVVGEDDIHWALQCVDEAVALRTEASASSPPWDMAFQALQHIRTRLSHEAQAPFHVGRLHRSDYTDEVATIPEEFLRAPAAGAAPVHGGGAAHQQQQGARGYSDHVRADASMLEALFQSLLPWVGPPGSTQADQR